MSALGTYGTSTPSTTNSGSFPGAAAGGSFSSQLATIAAEINGMQPGQFAADYGVSSTELPTYYFNGQYTTAAYSLAYYDSLSQGERQAIQDQMVTAGLISAASATGMRGGASLTAFKDLAGVTSAQQSNPFDWLNANATPLNAIQRQISSNLTVAEKEATAPEVATVSNPTTLSAGITSAFEQALGYSPDEAQINAFISQIQGQETQVAGAPRAAAQAEINQAKTETAALDAMGPDDVDKVLQAYTAAVNGSGLAGAGTPQGPQNGIQAATPPLGVRFGQAGAGTPQANEVGGTPTGTPSMGASKQVPQGLISSIIYSLRHNTFSVPDQTMGTSSTVPAPRSGASPLGHGVWPGTVPTVAPGGGTLAKPVSTYGGTYALSQADWAEAVKDYPPAKKYATPGEAPQAVQQAAFTALLLKAFTAHNDSWAAAVAAIASGTPLGGAKGFNTTAFGQQVASQVNAQIAALQNTVNNSPVTVKVDQPDITAEANLAAKQSDPTGYEAAQVASWGEELNQMLQGSPQYYNNATSDTFTGPVSAGVLSGNSAGKI